MYIHAGKNIIVSDTKILGIFNAKTLFMSEINKRYFDGIKSEDKTVIIDRTDKYITSQLNSTTIINRAELKDNIVWRREE
jgi:hypothetical protein